MISTVIPISVIIPVYNAASFIVQTVEGVLKEMPSTVELILVNDGSTDATGLVLENLKKRFPSIRTIQLEKNMGKGFALKKGFREAHGEYVAFTDADLPYGVAIFGDMTTILSSDVATGLVYGSRSHEGSIERRGYGIIRKCGRLFFSAVVRGLVEPTVSDTQCGIKMMRRVFVERVLAVSRIDRFAFDVELFAIAKVNGYASVPVPVSLYHRKESSVRLFTDTFGMLRDIWKIRGNVQHGLYHKVI